MAQPLQMGQTRSAKKTARPLSSSRWRWGKLIVVPVILLAGLYFYPFLWVVGTSLKTLPDAFNPHVGLFPSQLDWQNYLAVFQRFPFFQDLLNTLVISVAATAGAVISSAWVAYAFSQLRWRGRDSVLLIVMAHMLIPVWITIIPLYVIYVHIGWINTFWPLIMPSWFGSSFSIFLFRQFFLRHPPSLLDAARVDGASEVWILLRVILPLSRPVLAVVTLINFVSNWNDFFSPLVFLSSPAKYTLMLGLSAFKESHLTIWTELMAADVVIILPLVVLFFFTQRQFMEGLHVTGING